MFVTYFGRSEYTHGSKPSLLRVKNISSHDSGAPACRFAILSRLCDPLVR
jgi:hypothetical protein